MIALLAGLMLAAAAQSSGNSKNDFTATIAARTYRLEMTFH